MKPVVPKGIQNHCTAFLIIVGTSLAHNYLNLIGNTAFYLWTTSLHFLKNGALYNT